MDDDDDCEDCLYLFWCCEYGEGEEEPERRQSKPEPLPSHLKGLAVAICEDKDVPRAKGMRRDTRNIYTE